MRLLERKLLFTVTFILVALGLFFIFDVSAPSSLVRLKAEDPYYVVKHQFLALVIGTAAMFAASYLDTRVYHYLAPLLYAVAVICLALPLFIGEDSHGATRWIKLFGFSIQTSEIAKFCLIASFAWLVGKRDDVWGFVGFIALPTLLMILQKDFGTLVIMIAPLYIMYFLVHHDWKSFLRLTVLGLVILLIIMLADDYRRQRVLAFLPESIRISFLSKKSDQNDEVTPIDVDTYHVDQLQYTIGSGRLFGVGMGQSRQKRTLPEIHTDSIFAIYAEETGFIGVSLAMILYLCFLGLIARIAASPALMREPKLIGYGIFVSFVCQILVNLAAISGAAPLTGITLPFFSYGGSSLVMSMFTTGVVLSLARTDVPEPTYQIKRKKYV